MPLTIHHATLAASVIAAAVGTVAIVRTLPGKPAAPSASVAPLQPGAPPPPSKCKQACEALAKWCVAGRAINCVDLLTRYDREHHVTCDDGISAEELASLGWCPDGGSP